MSLATRVAVVLKGAEWVMNHTARRHPVFAARLKERPAVVQLRLRDSSAAARHFTFGAPRVRSGAGLHARPDVTLTFKNALVAWHTFKPGAKRADAVNFAKNFSVEVAGDDELACWFTETISLMRSVRWKIGVDAGAGETRLCNGTNSGPVFVYVKDGKIVRVTPLDFDERDPQSWSIEARGRTFSPPRKTTTTSHTLASKSMVYSPDRLLHPLKRVDFDPKGERNPQNRGKSGYERISWDEALDIVVAEIARVKRVHGHGAIMNSHSSHHTWGNIGVYVSAFNRFMNAIGYTKMVINPDSWEGWYWGATHHYGYSMRLGACEPYGMLEDCLQEAEMVVFWSSDPEATGGSYGAHEGTLRRLFARDIGMEFVHIDPHYNHTAALLGGKWIPIVPGTSPALAHAIAYVWMTEDLYDKQYVAERTTGFEKYQAYVLGTEDGVPKSPEWQAPETGVPAHTVRALARKWATRKTYLGAGGKGTTFGGACRSATGSQWARAMVCLMAMRGLGKPGINFGNFQYGAPIDYNFYFPGYGEGGISGDVETTGAAVQLYQRQPQLPSMNVVTQRITRNRIASAILEGKAEGHPIDPKSINGQFGKFHYPAPGHSRVRMMYKYGGSHFGTVQESNRLAEAYQSRELEFVVNQSIWHEGESKFADVILPACTNFERWDIGEWAVAGGYSHHNNGQLNHRVISIQHKCIEPLGESRSDYRIFLDIMHRMGLGTYYGEGMTELDWCRMQFEASDVPAHLSWEEFLRRGYYVVPPEDPKKTPQPVAMRWYAEGRRKDVPEPHPLPAGYGKRFREELQTQSGKIEFEASSLKMFDDPGRPPLNRYIPSWEGRGTTELYARYPLQLLTPHPRYSFHTHTDGKSTFINDIVEHRVLVDGYYYLSARMHPEDAAARGIAHHDLIRLYNDRASVICAAQITARILRGVVQASASSAVYDPIGEPGRSPDRGGCVNALAPTRWQTEKTSASAPNSCLIQVEKWSGR
jgi:molybdopterin guanine dinucleotide-containing S/N-oxide reductase-like protein